MLNRTLTLSLALAAVFGAQAFAADAAAGAPPAAGVVAPATAPVVGKFVSLKDKTLEIKVGKEVKTFTISDATKVTLDGGEIKAADLMAGQKLTVTTDASGAVTSIAAEKKAEKKEGEKKDGEKKHKKKDAQ